MPTALVAKITQAGANKIANAIATDIPIVINQMAVGTSAYNPTISQTALVSEAIRNPIASKTIISGSPNTFNVTGQFTSTTPITAREFGVFTNDGTLLAVWSQAGYIGIPIADPNFTVLTFTIQIDANCPVTIEDASVRIDFFDDLYALAVDISALATAQAEIQGEQIRQHMEIVANRERLRYFEESGQLSYP